MLRKLNKRKLYSGNATEGKRKPITGDLYAFNTDLREYNVPEKRVVQKVM